MAALYLQVSIISQALIFVTRSRSWSYVERPGLLLLGAFMIAQLVSIHFSLPILILKPCKWCAVCNYEGKIILLCNWQIATFLAVYANWGFARIKGMGWGWAGVIWLYSLVTYIPLDLLKFAIRYVLSGKAWDNLLENKVASFLLPFFSLFLVYFCVFDVVHSVQDSKVWMVLIIADCLHHKERLWQRRERSPVGSCTENSAWSSATRNHKPFQWQE